MRGVRRAFVAPLAIMKQGMPLATHADSNSSRMPAPAAVSLHPRPLTFSRLPCSGLTCGFMGKCLFFQARCRPKAMKLSDSVLQEGGMPACRHMVHRRTLRGLHCNQRQLRCWKRWQLEQTSREESSRPRSKESRPPVSTLHPRT